jgi:hypothetical protein
MSHLHASSVGVALLLASLSLCAEPRAAAERPAFSLYVAQLSGERTWQKVLTKPGGRFVDAYLVAGAVAMPYARFMHGALRLEAEGQLVYNFGAQDHWEINAVPVVARWQRFPWSERLATSAAFGLGLSYATELPSMERTLEGDSQQFLVHWFAEMTAGPIDAPWAMSLRLHHRSDGLGLLGTQGGMNALGLGVRVAF